MIGAMPAPVPPTFFVITTRGQVGPFNHADLRRALASGEVAAGDQVRTPFGSQLGSVGRVLQRESRGSPATPLPQAPAPAPPVASPRPAIIGISVALAAIIGGALLLWRPAQPPPVVAPVAAPDDRAVIAAPDAPARPVPESPVQPAKVAPEPAKPVAAAKPPSAKPTRPVDAYENLLLGRTDRGWDKGQGTKVNFDGSQWAYRLMFDKKDAWAGTTTFDNFRDFSGSAGLLLVIDEAKGGRLTCEVVEESSRERHVATFDPPAAGGEVRLPWSGFVRRADKQDGKKPPADDGLQLTCIRYLAFFPAEGQPANIRLRRIALYR